MRVLLALLSFLTAASQATPAPTPVSPDRAELVLGDECAAPVSFSPPFTRVYRFANGGRLVFVAVRHGDDAPTRGLLNAAFGRYHPDLALVEGIGSSRRDDAAHRERMAAYAESQLAAGKPNEVATTIKLAADAHAAFSGWDLTPEEDYAASLARGFALVDVVGAHLVRLKVDPFADAAPALAGERRAAASAGTVDGFDYSAWYRQHYGDRFAKSNGTPCGAGVAAHIVKAETAARNRNAVKVLSHAVTPGRTVLIEAGANHWLALDPWLQSVAVREAE